MHQEVEANGAAKRKPGRPIGRKNRPKGIVTPLPLACQNLCSEVAHDLRKLVVRVKECLDCSRQTGLEK